MMRSKLLFFALVWVVFIGLAVRHFGPESEMSAARIPASAAPASAPQTLPKTLYERFGGRASIEAWSSELEKLVDADPRMMTNGQVRADWAKADRTRLRRAFVEFLCERTEGPCRYSGPALRKAFDPLSFGKIEWVYLKEAYLMALRKARPDLSADDRAQLEHLFDEAQTLAGR
jgi:hypothetical protein